MQEMNGFYLERMVRMRLVERGAEADRERVARRLTAHHGRFAWVRHAVSALAGRPAGFLVREVAGERIDL